MAKSFSSAEAKYLINEHQKIIRNLASASNMLKEYAFEIEDNADDLRDREVKEALRKMPIEDINRGKRGFRIKALKDAGIKNFADLKDMTWNELGNVYGISESSAYEIKELSEDIEEQVKKGIKLRISEDVKMKEATRLLSSILKYRSVKPIAEKCKEIISAVGLQVNNAIDDLMVGTSFFRWIFASAARKQQAENAYRYLKQLIDGEYAENVNRIVDELSEVEDSYSGKDAWTAFSRNSIVFFNTLEEVNPEILGEDDQIYGLPEYLAEEIQDETIYSEGLKCNLRHYQEWGVKYALHQKYSSWGRDGSWKNDSSDSCDGFPA